MNTFLKWLEWNSTCDTWDINLSYLIRDLSLEGFMRVVSVYFDYED